MDQALQIQPCLKVPGQPLKIYENSLNHKHVNDLSKGRQSLNWFLFVLRTSDLSDMWLGVPL